MLFGCDEYMFMLSGNRWNIQLMGCDVNAYDAIYLCCQGKGEIFS